MKRLSIPSRFGTFINTGLLLLVIGTALLLVRWQYESRRLYVLLEKSDHIGRQLASDAASASADKRELSSPARAERIATQQLNMKPADASVTLYLGSQP
jgi:cell division protein FtsL